VPSGIAAAASVNSDVRRAIKVRKTITIRGKFSLLTNDKWNCRVT